MTRPRSGQQGFTLIEIMIGLLIIGALLAVGLPALLAQQDRAKDSDARTYLVSLIKNARGEAKGNNEDYPAIATLRTTLQQNEPQFNIVAGGPSAADANKKVVVDNDSTVNGLIMHTLSGASKLYSSTSTPQGSLGYGRYAAEVFTDNPISYWRLGDRSIARAAPDFGGGSNPAAYGSAVTPGADGALRRDPDKAVSLTGAAASVLSVPHAPNIQPAGAFSIEAWAKPSSLSTVGVRGIVEKGTSTPPYTLGQSSANFTFNVRRSDGNNVTIQGPVLAAGQWHHIVGTWDGTSTVRLYINGVEAATNATVNTITANTNSMRIGEATSGTFTGCIDDVSYYNSELTPARITKHYQAASEG